MKKYLLSLITLIYLAEGNAQTVRASIGAGSTSNSVRIYLQPDITNAAVAISTLQFNIAIPAGITPVPALAVTTNNIGGGTIWNVEPPYTEGGFIHYNIYNNQSLYTLNCTAGTEFQAMEVTFTGGPAGTFANTANLVTLPDGGGGSGFALFYCTSAVGGVLNSNGQSLYYARDANVVFANGDTYRYVPGGVDRPQGTFTSFARLVTGITFGGTLPVLFASYDVKCNDKGAVLTWSTATEQNSNRFEIQRSTNGTDWVTIDNVAAAGNSDVLRKYQYVDLNGGTAFYRIRQVDNDGRFVYTAVKGTNCKIGQFDVTLYPVPTRDKLNVVIKSDKAVRTDLQVVDVSGRIVNRTTTQVNKGNNNIVLNLEHLPAGQYMLVSSDPAITINKKFTIIR